MQEKFKKDAELFEKAEGLLANFVRAFLKCSKLNSSVLSLLENLS